MKTLKFDDPGKTSKSNFPVSRASGVRIVLIDDHEVFRAGMRSLISAKRDFRIAGEAKDKAEAIELVKREQPDVILLNIEMIFGDGLEMIPALFAACKTSRLAVLTGSKDPEIHRQAMELGAIGVISKEDPPDLMMHAITRIHGGGVWLDRYVTARMLGSLSAQNKRQNLSSDGKRIQALTGRERDVIKQVGFGLNNKQIAERLFISAITVHHHLTSIYSKLEVADRVELLVYAYRNRLADLPH